MILPGSRLLLLSRIQYKNVPQVSSSVSRYSFLSIPFTMHFVALTIGIVIRKRIRWDSQYRSALILQGAYIGLPKFHVGRRANNWLFWSTLGGSKDSGKSIPAGLSFGYSWSEDHASSVSATVTCPKHHTCRLQATAQMFHVKSYTGVKESVGKELPTERKQFEVFYPITIVGAAKDNEAVVAFSACTIGDKDSKSYPQCHPMGESARAEEYDPIGAQRVGKLFNSTCW